MPNTELTTPTATAPVDRLSLTANSARSGAANDGAPSSIIVFHAFCFADDAETSPSWDAVAAGAGFCFADEA